MTLFVLPVQCTLVSMETLRPNAAPILILKIWRLTHH